MKMKFIKNTKLFCDLCDGNKDCYDACDALHATNDDAETWSKFNKHGDRIYELSCAYYTNYAGQRKNDARIETWWKYNKLGTIINKVVFYGYDENKYISCDVTKYKKGDVEVIRQYEVKVQRKKNRNGELKMYEKLYGIKSRFEFDILERLLHYKDNTGEERWYAYEATDELGEYPRIISKR